MAKMSANQKQIYRDIREGVRTGNKKLVEISASKLYQFESKHEKELIKKHLYSEGLKHPAKAYGADLADTLLRKANERGTLTIPEMKEAQKYFGLKMSDEQRGAIITMRAFRRTQRKDYEAFRKLSGAPNSFEAIGRDLVYKGGDRKNGYKYEYTDKNGNIWTITTPKYDRKTHQVDGFTFRQTGKKKPDPTEENSMFKDGMYQ